jgi:hypothetical protein
MHTTASYPQIKDALKLLNKVSDSFHENPQTHTTSAQIICVRRLTQCK